MFAVMAAVMFAGAFAAAGEVIGVAMPTQSEERWVLDLQTMVSEGRKLGLDVRTQIARNDQMQQNNQIDQLVAQGCRVIIIAPHDGDSAAAAVNKARQDGVKIIAYDRLITNCEYEAFAGFNSVQIGNLQGKWLTERAPKGNYICLSGAPTDFNSQIYHDGAMEYIRPLVDKGDITIVVDQPVIDWQPVNAQRIVENALTKANNDVVAVLAPNDGTAGGAIAALEAQGLAGKVFVSGQDAEVSAIQRIVRGVQGMTVLVDTRELGKAAVTMAQRMLRNEPIDDLTKGHVEYNGVMDIPAVLLDTASVDITNYGELLFDSGYMKREDVFGD
jgi:D-xylose transport system substrate-binding protein